MGKTIGRRVADIAQKSRGRIALRYEIEVIPYFCSDLPKGVKSCCFTWERGNKIYLTEAEDVNQSSNVVFWKQYLRQSATFYKDSKEAALLAKDYAFKVQSVRVDKETGEERRKTVGKVHLNMSQYCTDRHDGQPQEMLLHLKPAGKLKVSVKTTFQRNARIDPDAMTEVTTATGVSGAYTDEAYYEEGNEEGEGYHSDERAGFKEEEQDLSGFDPDTGLPLHHGGGRGRRHGGGGEGEEGEGEAYDAEGRPRRQRRQREGGRRGRHRRPQGAEDTVQEGGEGEEGWQEGGEADDRGEGADGGTIPAEGGPRRGRRKKQPQEWPQDGDPGGSSAPPDGGAAGPRPLGIQGGPSAGRQLRVTTWRDYLCCCLPRPGPAEDPLEGASLLANPVIHRQGQGQGQGGAKLQRYS